MAIQFEKPKSFELLRTLGEGREIPCGSDTALELRINSASYRSVPVNSDINHSKRADELARSLLAHFQRESPASGSQSALMIRARGIIDQYQLDKKGNVGTLAISLAEVKVLRQALFVYDVRQRISVEREKSGWARPMGQA